MNAITKQTRRESYLNRPVARSVAILEVLGDNLMTSREIAKEMGYLDLNAVKPRLTELLDGGLVEVAGKVLDETTNRSVVVWKTVDREEQ